jgi:hypothetical protein
MEKTLEKRVEILEAQLLQLTNDISEIRAFITGNAPRSDTDILNLIKRIEKLERK